MTIKDTIIQTHLQAKKIGQYSFNILAITFVIHLVFEIEVVLYSVISLVVVSNFVIGAKSISCPKCKLNLLKVKENIKELNYCPQCSLDINEEQEAE